MATHVWRGDAAEVAQVDSITPANVGIGDIFTLTINGKSVSFVATAATVANVTAGLTAAWNASTVPEHEEITATDSTTHVTLTADVPGVPFTVTATEEDGDASDDQTLTRAAVTANAGPNVWAAANFDSATLPDTGDTVIIENSSTSILYGLDQSSKTLAALDIRQSFTGYIGLPRTNENGYIEYRDQYLKISATAISIGGGEGDGSGRIKLNTGSNQTTMRISNKGSRVETGIPCVLFLGTHASNAITAVRGDLGICFFGGEVATVAALGSAYLTSESTDATIVARSGATLTTVTVHGGDVQVESAVTTVNQSGGSLTIGGTATVAALNIDGGTTYYQSSGTATAVAVGGGGTLDFRRDLRARTVTAITVAEGATLLDPYKTVTWTNGIDLVRCSNLSATVDIGEHFTLTPSAI